MTRLVLSLGLLAALAHGAGAQSVPNIMKSKQAATRAVEATNRQVEANSTLPDEAPDQQRRARPADSTRRVTGTDSASGAADVPSAGKGSAFERETFNYARSGRRDPFISLMNTSDLRPLISDLRLAGITFDASGRNSIAVLRDLGTNDQYRVRVGHSLGRMRVASINPRSVVFTIEEFGYSRQETLPLGDSNQVRKQ